MNRAQRRAMKKKGSVVNGPPLPTKRDADHESAHALVGLRLGLPVTAVDVRRRPLPEMRGPEGHDMWSVGFTALRDDTKQGYLDALPHPHARERVESLGVFAAAGLVSEWTHTEGEVTTDPAYVIATTDDQEALVFYADALGENAEGFASMCAERAGDILFENDGETWQRLSRLLLDCGHLDHDRISDIIDRIPAIRGEVSE